MTLGRLITMATRKGLSLIYEIQNFGDTYLGKVMKFQSNGLFRFEVLSHLLGRWKTPPSMNRVNKIIQGVSVTKGHAKQISLCYSALSLPKPCEDHFVIDQH